MKKTKNIYRFIVAAVIVFSISITPSNAQERINLSLGVGFNEGFNIGARYQLKQAQLGLSIDPGIAKGFHDGNRYHTKPNQYFVVSGSFYKHLWGTSKLSDRKPWFLKLGTSFDWSRNTYEGITWHDGWANLYIGRDINVSNRFGFSLATGVISRFYSESSRRTEYLRRDVFLSPGVGEFNLYYRLL